MKSVRLISSPKMDYALAPSEPRRYVNQIFWFYSFFFSLFFFFSTRFAFKPLNFFKLTWQLYTGNQEVLHQINLMTYGIFTVACLIISIVPAHFLTKICTRPVTRQTIQGAFIDDSEEVFENFYRDVKRNAPSKTIMLIRKGEHNWNNIIFNKNRKIKVDIPLPETNLELSFVMRGEAGSGKTSFGDRLMKEYIEAGHRLIVHNIKGDEFGKLNGFTNMFLIEPWNKNMGYAINFMAFMNIDEETKRDAFIKLFVNSFCSKSANKGDKFFDESAQEVLFAIVKKAVEDEMQLVKSGKKKAFRVGLSDIVKIWINFNADTTEQQAGTEKLSEEQDTALEKIKKLMIEKNPTQSMLIDPENAKTSLCILATCTKTIKKLEVLSKFWGDKEYTKSIDLMKWVSGGYGKKHDKPVLVLSNSNLYKSEADSYISAVVNLLTAYLIGDTYQKKGELHFFLDEFPQLRSIDLQTFMQLPDVGRSKGIHCEIFMQRSSQIKTTWDIEPSSFIGAFHNKLWARFSTTDFEEIEKELGKNTIIETTSTQNFNAQGTSSSGKTTEKTANVINPSQVQKDLQPVKRNGKTVGVRLLLNLTNINRVIVATFPFVNFEKKHGVKAYKFESVAGSDSIPLPKSNAKDDKDTMEIVSIEQENTVLLDTSAKIEEVKEEGKESMVEEVAKEMLEQVVHHFAGENTEAVMQLAEMIEHLEVKNQNSNVQFEDNTSTLEKIKKTRKSRTLDEDIEI